MTELYKRDGRSLFSAFSKLNTKSNKTFSFFNGADNIPNIETIDSIVTDEYFVTRYVPSDNNSRTKDDKKNDMKYFKSQRFFGRKKTFKI